MSLYNDASLLLIPSGYKAGTVFSQKPTDGDGDLTFTRNSTATRVNSDGLIESVAANVPRLDYSQGSCPAMLLEPQRTNLLLYSNVFTTTGWIAVESTITNNYSLSPDGTNNANRWLSNVGSTGTIISFGPTNTDNTTYTISCWVKSNGNGKDKFRFIISSSFISSDITATSEWQRFTFTATRGTVGTRYGLIRPSDLSEVDLQIFGAQLEVGAFPTSYIPTSGTTATRLADTFTRNNIYTNGLITSIGGTWFLELKNNIIYTRDISTFSFFIGDTLSGTTNSIVFRNQNTTARLTIARFISGAFLPLYNTITDNVKIAIKWNGTTLDIFANGVKVVSGSPFTPTIMNFLATTTGTRDVPLFVQQMALFLMPLSDAQAIELTTI